MRACWLKWVGRDWSISADYIWLNYSGANSIPKLRSGSFFPDDVIERHRRVDRALVAAVAEMYATGTSTRKVQRVAEKIGVSRLSKDQVSAIASSLDQASGTVNNLSQIQPHPCKPSAQR